MSKTRRKSHDEVEHLRGIIRALKSEVRHLKRELNRLDNIKYELTEFREAFEEFAEPVQEVRKDVCTHCTRGEYKPIPIPGGRTFMSCSVCGHRKVVKDGLKT